MQQTTSSAEKVAPSGKGTESQAALVVSQPPKVEMLLEAIDKISERIGEDRSGDPGSAGSSGQARGSAVATTRDQKIADIPEPATMRTELKKHIDREVVVLQKEIRKAARRVSRPGGAYRLSMLYARLRRLNALISELFDAAYDTLKRLFIKVVIDNQKVL